MIRKSRYKLYLYNMQSSFRLLLAVTISLIIPSCFAMQNIFQTNKTTQSYATFNIFLNPDSLAKKNIYVNIKNSTIYKEFEVRDVIKENLANRGYNVKNSSSEADLIISSNIRYYGIFERDILNAMLEDKTKKENTSGITNDYTDFSRTYTKSKYNVDFSGMVIGGVSGFVIFGSLFGAIGGGILIGGSAIALEAIYSPKIILAFVDVQIAERVEHSIMQYNFNQVHYGEGGSKKLEYQENVNFKTYQTQIIIVSRNSNLKDKEALSDTKKQIIASLSNLI